MSERIITPEHEEVFRRLIEIRELGGLLYNHEVWFEYDISRMKNYIDTFQEENKRKALVKKIKDQQVLKTQETIREVVADMNAKSEEHQDFKKKYPNYEGEDDGCCVPPI